MGWEILLAAALEAGLSVLAEAGFGDAVREARIGLTKADEKKRRQAFEEAFDRAVDAAADPTIRPLLEHRPFQEEVLSALLDPVQGLDVQAAAAIYGERLPEHARALRKFFGALENALLDDDTWGPVLARYQDLRARQDINEALQAQNLALSAREIVRQQSVILSGSGSVSQGSGAAAGAHGQAISHSTARDIIGPGGSKIEIHHHNPPAPEGPDPRIAYLRRLRRTCEVLPLATLGGEEGANEDLTLNQVYIALDTTTAVPLSDEEKKAQKDRGVPIPGREAETRRLTALEAAAKATRLVLLGDPGAGKSTFGRELLARLAAANLKEGQPSPGMADDLLPILVVLRDLAPRLAALDLAGRSGERQREALAAAVREQMLDDLKRLEAAGFAKGMSESLRGGRCLLVFDGLDEVPYELRARVRQAVAAVIRQYNLARIIVTCRIRSYTGDAILPDFQTHTLAPFDEKKIRDFVNAWYEAQKTFGRVDAEQARRKAADLSQAALSADLRELSENPMMLTTMAIIHQREIGLPKERVRLYKLAVEVLVRRWQQRKTGERGLVPSAGLADFLKDDLRLRPTMERLAYEAQVAKQAGQASLDLARGNTLALLENAAYLGDAGLAAEFLDYVDQRAGLLIGRGGEAGRPATYSFPHRTFQEYLAGCYLIGQRGVERAYFEHAAEGDYWGLAARLGAEELLYNRLGETQLLDLAYHLCPHREPQSTQERRAELWAGGMAVLAGRERIERDTGSIDGGKPFLDRLIPRLVALLASDLTPIERADAGVALANLGDPRPAVMTIEGMEFCCVPAGPFVMGSKDDSRAYDDESPQHTLTLAYDYWMGRYPVTNAQYAVFVEKGGYAASRYWAEAARAGYWKDGLFKDWDDKLRSGPADYGEPFNLSNHPVVGVTWYEALAFTRWLADYLHGTGTLPAVWTVRLPSEAEWEKAARGGLEIPASPAVPMVGAGLAPALAPDPASALQPNPDARRIYPWGDEIDAQRVNYDDTGIGTTSAVGCFPGGASPYGVEDLSGNVWEWTRSLWGKGYSKPDFGYPYDSGDGRENLEALREVLRVVRGGRFANNERLVRCAFRLRHHPDALYVYYGFRVVLSPL